MGNRITETMDAMDAINAMAREARRLCTDIIRQTSLQPYYGKVGGAAFYAADDGSKAQQLRIKEATRNLRRANGLLHDIAVAGGMTDAKIVDDMRGDYGQTCIMQTDDTHGQ